MEISPLLKQLLRRTGILFVIFIAAPIIRYTVTFPPKYETEFHTALHYITVIAFFFQAILWVNALIAYWSAQYIARHKIQRGDLTTIQAVAVAMRIVMIALLVVLALRGLHQDVTTLLTGLGIGGIAIAFALQNVLSDLFGAFSILLDKPFVVGDAIQVDTLSGTVERIGLKSTRVRSDDGDQIVFGNGDLLKSRIRNLGRMEERRSIVTTRVTATTPVDALTRIPKLLQEIIEAQPDIRFGRSHLKSISDATIDFESVYYSKNTSYKFFLDTQQSIIITTLNRFAAEKIQLAAQLETATKQAVVTPPAPSAPPPPSAPPAPPAPAPPPHTASTAPPSH